MTALKIAQVTALVFVVAVITDFIGIRLGYVNYASPTETGESIRVFLLIGGLCGWISIICFIIHLVKKKKS